MSSLIAASFFQFASKYCYSIMYDNIQYGMTPQDGY